MGEKKEKHLHLGTIHDEFDSNYMTNALKIQKFSRGRPQTSLTPPPLSLEVSGSAYEYFLSIFNFFDDSLKDRLPQLKTVTNIEQPCFTWSCSYFTAVWQSGSFV